MYLGIFNYSRGCALKGTEDFVVYLLYLVFHFSATHHLGHQLPFPSLSACALSGRKLCAHCDACFRCPLENPKPRLLRQLRTTGPHKRQMEAGGVGEWSLTKVKGSAFRTHCIGPPCRLFSQSYSQILTIRQTGFQSGELCKGPFLYRVSPALFLALLTFLWL